MVSEKGHLKFNDQVCYENQQLHAVYIIPRWYAHRIMTSHIHVEYIFPGGHLEECFRFFFFSNKINPSWISMDISDSGMHFMAVGEHCILAVIL